MIIFLLTFYPHFSHNFLNLFLFIGVFICSLFCLLLLTLCYTIYRGESMDQEYLLELINSEECEWIEFKENWFDKYELGCYISALSNSATENGEDYAYFIWGIQDQTHEIIGTTFDYNKNVNNEPLKHYLARLLSPSIAFTFETFSLDGKKIVCLTIPAAKRIMTEFDKNRYIRIGSSKELLRKYPEREIDLAVTLKNGYPTIINTPSRIQDLDFSDLKAYYLAKGAYVHPDSFEENLGLFVPNTKKYNILAYILSNNNDISCRVSVFSGKKKSDSQYSLNDFGRKCIFLTIDQILNFLESFNITKLDEKNRIVERKEISLFNSSCLREAILNAFMHNDWVDLNAPMISVFTDRIEILSYGSLPNKQTKSGFFAGKSKPRCLELAEIFVKLKISERAGRGVPKIVDTYGMDVIEIAEDYIKVTIPYAFERTFGNSESEQKVSKKSEQKKKHQFLSKTDKIKWLILQEMENDSSITTSQLMEITDLKKTAVQNYLKDLTKNGYIKRIGSKRSGYWKVIKQTFEF